MSNFLIDEDTGLLAAEFVLGTLDSAERTHAHSLLKVDHGFIAMVRIWERRFGDLHLMVEPVEPDGKILERIKAKLPAPPPASVEPVGTGADAAKTPPMPPPGESPKPATVETGASAPTPSAAAAEAPKPPEVAKPPETPATPEPPQPPAAALATQTIASPTLPPATSIPPSPDARLPEEKSKNGRGPLPKAGILPAPPPQSPPPLKLPEKDRSQDRFQDRRLDRRSEVTIDVIRSRRRWRVFGILMILFVFGFAGLVGAWRIAPERLPPVLQPSAVMMMIGLQPGQTPPLPHKEPPPESQFDE